MIQRIQSIWLLLAALVNVALFYTCLYKAHEMVNGVDSTTCLRVNDHYPTMLIALVTIALPVVAIFLFKNRKRQRMVTFFAILANISLVSAILVRVSQFNKHIPPPTDGSYATGSVLPVIAVILLFMAMRNIVKDEKLVKSLDRLR